jgi:Cu-Zn family superoxide dismutase
MMAATAAATVVPAATVGAKNARAERHASAELRDPAGATVGWAKFHEDGGGRVHVNVHVDGLPAGTHGLHVHATGSCEHGAVPFAGAGAHHKPSPPTAHPHHAGDLPNLVIKSSGKGHLNTKTLRFTLRPSPTTIFDANGSSLIIHALPDDLHTDPTGNSGARIACGVIATR